jgi:acetyltransferase-like isoleucine patch superfamily enzyme
VTIPVPRQRPWAERVSRWRRLPQKYGGWWWWMWLTMQLSDWPVIGRPCMWLAGLPLGAYKHKWPLARVTGKPYISPRAQVACPQLSLGRGCFIDDDVTLFAGRGGGAIVLGPRVHLNRGSIIEVGQGGGVVIGEDTHVQSSCNLNGYKSSIRIGRHVMLAPGCGLFSYQHRFDDRSRPINQQPLTSKGDIVLEDDVWLGAGVKVMDGVTVGQGAVVGAGAVVLEDIPAFAVAAGVPARVVRLRP